MVSPSFLLLIFPLFFTQILCTPSRQEEKEVLPFAVVESAVLTIAKTILSACQMEHALLNLKDFDHGKSVAQCILEGKFESEKLENIQIRKELMESNLGKAKEYLRKISKFVGHKTAEFVGKFNEEREYFEQTQNTLNREFLDGVKIETKLEMGRPKRADYLAPAILANFIACIKFYQYAYAIYYEALKVLISGKIYALVRENGGGWAMSAQRRGGLKKNLKKNGAVEGKAVVGRPVQSQTSRKLVQLDHHLQMLLYLRENAENLVDMLKQIIFGNISGHMERKWWLGRQQELEHAADMARKNIKQRDIIYKLRQNTGERKKKRELDEKLAEINAKIDHEARVGGPERRARMGEVKDAVAKYSEAEGKMMASGEWQERVERYFGGELAKIVGDLREESLLPIVEWKSAENLTKLTINDVPKMGTDDALALVHEILQIVWGGNGFTAKLNEAAARSSDDVAGLVRHLVTTIHLGTAHAEFWTFVTGDQGYMHWMDTVAGAQMLALAAQIGRNLKGVLLLEQADPLRPLYDAIRDDNQPNVPPYGPVDGMRAEFGLQKGAEDATFVLVLSEKCMAFLEEAKKTAWYKADWEVPESWYEDQFELAYQVEQVGEFAEIKDDALPLPDAVNLSKFISKIQMPSWEKTTLPKLPFEDPLGELAKEVRREGIYSKTTVANIDAIVALAKSHIDRLGDFYDFKKYLSRSGNINVVEECAGFRHLFVIGSILVQKLREYKAANDASDLEEGTEMEEKMALLEGYLKGEFSKFKGKSKSESIWPIHGKIAEQNDYDKNHEEMFKNELKEWLTERKIVEKEMRPFLQVAAIDGI